MTTDNCGSVLPDINHFSKWLCLIRSTAIVLSTPDVWIRKSRPELSQERLQQAEERWIIKSQQECFGAELDALKKRIQYQQTADYVCSHLT